MKLRRLLGSAAIAFGLTSALSATTITQTFTFTPHNTDIASSSTSSSGATGFAYFQTLVPGATLNGVTLQVQITETVESLSIHNNSTTTSQTYGYTTANRFTLDCGATATTTANSFAGCVTNQDVIHLAGGAGTGGSGFVIGNTINGALSSTQTLYNFGTQAAPKSQVVAQSIAASGDQIVLPGPASPTFDSGVITSGTGTVTYNSGVVNSSNVASYNTTGFFDFGYLTSTDQTFTGGGGSLLASQLTKTSAVYSVSYDYTIPEVPSGVPEPATMALLGSALIGVAVIRKRTRKS